MHELIINGQPITHTYDPDTTHYTPVEHAYLVDDTPHLFISDITGTITIRQSNFHDITIRSPIPVTTSHDHVANSVTLCPSKLPDPPPQESQESQITFPVPATPIALEIIAMPGVTIHLSNINGKVIIDSLICHLTIKDCPACNLTTPGSSIRSLTANLIGNSQTEINFIEGNAKITAHDSANILISSGIIHQLDLTTYGSAFAKIKSPIDGKTILTNAGIHNIHLEKVIGPIIPNFLSTGDIVICAISESQSI